MVTSIKLSELNNRISLAISESFSDQKFWVIADITNHSFKSDKQTHYFELVEKETGSNNIIARISGRAWGSGSIALSDFEKNTGQRFSNNINVLVQVTVNYHPLYGLSLNVVDIDQNFTLGLLEQQRNATLQRLVSENDFIEKRGEQYTTTNNRLQLNTVIQHIALVSSSSSAGSEDFRHTLENNAFGYKFAVDEYHTTVQGDSNAKLFLDKLIEVYTSGKKYDAVVITRGGGAQTDFLIFDNYSIGRAVAKFPIPIITGIGHQKNISIVDLMAHTQTKTPTKAAEFIIAHNRDFEQAILRLQQNIIIKSQQLFLHNSRALTQLKSSIATNVRNILTHEKDSLVAVNQTAINASRTILNNRSRALLNASAQITSRPRVSIYNRINDLKNITGNLQAFTSQYIKNQRAYLGHYNSTIKIMAPENILKKGYALVQVNGKITSNPDEIVVGQNINVILSDTLLKTTVIQKSKYNGTDPNL